MKIYVRAMSLPKTEAVKRAGYYADDIMEHVIKIVVYHDIRHEQIDHWIGEISGWLKFVDGLTVKPSNKHLKPAMIRDTTFGPMGDHLQDYVGSLEMFQTANRRGKFNYKDKESYPYREPDAQTASDLMNICYHMIEVTIPMLCEKKDYTREDYVKVLEDVFRAYI